MSLDVEKELAELLIDEVMLHRTTEDYKQELASQKGYAQQTAFKQIDDVSMGFIYQKNLERYFNAQGLKTTDQDHFAIIRRIDMDADQKINQ
jgi:hypothetical protein